MGRRKIEIKAIKDDRNRSVTFLKRKGGLFKKAHELSVLCSVDVAVFVFGNNKKVYEYSSGDMRDLITRYQFHGGPNEHKGPSDFNGGNDEDEDDEADGSPSQGHESLDAQMMPPQFHGQPPNFAQLRHHTPSASPPMPNGSHFQNQPHHYPPQRGHTPQPPVLSRPGSRNDGRRMGPNMVNQQGPHPGITYMPTPPIYNPAQGPSNMMPPQSNQYPYPPPQQPQQPPQQQHQHQQQQQQQPPLPPQQHQTQPYMDDRQQAPAPGYAPHPPPQPISITRTQPSPPQPQQHSIPHISTPPLPDRRQTEPQPPPPVDIKTEQMDRAPPLLDTGIKKLPSRKAHSIFTPIEENRSILSQHLASFASEPQGAKSDAVAAAARAGSSTTNSSPPQHARSDIPSYQEKSRTVSISSVPETTFTPPSRSNSFQTGVNARARGPRLTVQIPDEAEPGSAGGDSNSPRGPADAVNQTTQRQNSVVLPPPSPSASTLLSAGATGPPNPFARPPPQQTVNGETPASALPSRFLGNDFLPSPSSFYNDWNFRGGDNNTLPSPINFATPVAGSGPSFLRDEPVSTAASSSGMSGNSLTVTSGPTGKRKTPDPSENDHHDDGIDGASEAAKRVKVN